MNRESRNLVLGVVLGLVLGGASAIGYAQVAVHAQPVAPEVFAADDLGFRMTARRGGTPVGQLVVRIDGEWKTVEFSHGVKLATR